MKALRTGLTVLLCVSAALSGCRKNDTEVRLEGTLRWGDCDSNLLPYDYTFATWSDILDDVGVLRFQDEDGAATAFRDYLVFTVTGRRELKNRVGEALEVGPPGSGAPVEGSLQFPVSCPEELDLLGVLIGTIVFDEFHGEQETRIAGSFEAQVVDGRDMNEVIGEDLTGSFSFVRRRNPPYQSFGLVNDPPESRPLRSIPAAERDERTSPIRTIRATQAPR